MWHALKIRSRPPPGTDSHGSDLDSTHTTHQRRSLQSQQHLRLVASCRCSRWWCGRRSRRGCCPSMHYRRVGWLVDLDPIPRKPPSPMVSLRNRGFGRRQSMYTVNCVAFERRHAQAHTPRRAAAAARNQSFSEGERGRTPGHAWKPARGIGIHLPLCRIDNTQINLLDCMFGHRGGAANHWSNTPTTALTDGRRRQPTAPVATGGSRPSPSHQHTTTPDRDQSWSASRQWQPPSSCSSSPSCRSLPFAPLAVAAAVGWLGAVAAAAMGGSCSWP